MTDADGPLALPGLPLDEDGPVFAEPWQAQAFAMAVRLHEQGLFTWTEWAAALSREIKAARESGDPDLGDTYYDHWLRALERLAAHKGVVSERDLRERYDAWDRAARATPHGEPIVLGRDDRNGGRP